MGVCVQRRLELGMSCFSQVVVAFMLSSLVLRVAQSCRLLSLLFVVAVVVRPRPRFLVVVVVEVITLKTSLTGANLLSRHGGLDYLRGRPPSSAQSCCEEKRVVVVVVVEAVGRGRVLVFAVVCVWVKAGTWL